VDEARPVCSPRVRGSANPPAWRRLTCRNTPTPCRASSVRRVNEVLHLHSSAIKIRFSTMVYADILTPQWNKWTLLVPSEVAAFARGITMRRKISRAPVVGC
jgi:hypothetical protein